MAFDINIASTKSVDLAVTVLGQTAVVTYNPGVLTQDNLDIMRGLAPMTVPATEADVVEDDMKTVGSVKQNDPFVAFFCRLVMKWDVVADGEPVPLTPDGLYAVPLVLLRAIYLKVMEQTSSGEAGGPSSDG